MTLTPRTDVDVAALKAEFADKGFVKIDDFIDEPSSRELIKNLPPAADRWQMTFRRDGRVEALEANRMQSMTERNRVKLSNEIYSAALNGPQFVYQKISLDEAATEAANKDEKGLLVREMLNSDAVLSLVKSVSGEEGLTRALSDATYFVRNQFKNREMGPDDGAVHVGFELYLTSPWREDFGGFLNFYDDDGNILDAVYPRFRQLVLYRLPRAHGVSALAPFCNALRFSISGSFTTD